LLLEEEEDEGPLLDEELPDEDVEPLDEAELD
jgi:hypothetical protein